MSLRMNVKPRNEYEANRRDFFQSRIALMHPQLLFIFVCLYTSQVSVTNGTSYGLMIVCIPQDSIVRL